MFNIIKMCLYCSTISPEGVSNAVLKVDESFTVYHKKVTTVEVKVSFHKHVLQLLLLCLLLVLGVANERRSFSDLCHK